MGNFLSVKASCPSCPSCASSASPAPPAPPKPEYNTFSHPPDRWEIQT